MRRFIVDGEQPPANLLPPIAALQTFLQKRVNILYVILSFLRFAFKQDYVAHYFICSRKLTI